MVLQHAVRSPSPNRHPRPAPGDGPRPDPVRIAGIAGALLLNSAALLLMLAPLGRPATAPKGPAGLEAEWFEPRPIPPPPPPELVPVQPTAPPPTAAPTPAVRKAVAEPAPVAPAITGTAGFAFDPLPDIAPGDAATGTAGPMAGAHLAYAEASIPPYPRDALRSGHQGTVVLQVLVGVDGRPLEVIVESGSGYRSLDEAARRHVLRHWRFQPAIQDGQPVQAIGLVPIEFSLGRY